MTFTQEVVDLYKIHVTSGFYSKNVWFHIVNDESHDMIRKHDVQVLKDHSTLIINQAHTLRGHIPSLSWMDMNNEVVEHQARMEGAGLANIFRHHLHHRFRILPEGRTVGSLETTQADFGDITHRSRILDRLWSAKNVADLENWPIAGRYVVMSAAYHALLARTVRGAMIATSEHYVGSQLPEWFDWNIIVDPLMPRAEEVGTEDHWMYFVKLGQSLDYMGEWRKFKGCESKFDNGIFLEMEYAYGLQIKDPMCALVVKTEVKE